MTTASPYRLLPAAGCSAALLLAIAACGESGSSDAAQPAQTALSPLPRVDVSHVGVSDPGSPLPEGWQHGAFIEIYVRGYKDTNGDGIGDLRGVTQKLDYLQDLGIKGIWLMPVTRSQDNDHGYAVTDYRDVETAYGSLADFDELVRQAHARGIGVIVDYVVNHSAAQHPVFLHSASAADNPYRGWYVWQDRVPQGWNIFGKNPWNATANGAYLSQFSPTMPDFNLTHPDVKTFHHDNLRFWLNRGVDGVRFDAVAHLIENGPAAWKDQPQNYTFVSELNAMITGYSRRYVVCEAVENPAAWATPKVCGSAFAFGHGQNIVEAARGKSAGIRAVADYFKTAPGSMATMISNHDHFAGERLWDQVGGNLAQYRLAAATYLLQPGTPFIYYGEEIGMAGVKSLGGDPSLRTPMSWTADAAAGFTEGKPFRPISPNVARHNVATQRSDPDSLFTFYRAMLKLRNSYPSIARGSYEAAFVSGSVMGFQRALGSERVVVLINYGADPATAAVQGLPAATRLTTLYPQNAVAGAGTGIGIEASAIRLPPQSVQVYLAGR
jgi:alpha-amylase